MTGDQITINRASQLNYSHLDVPSWTRPNWVISTMAYFQVYLFVLLGGYISELSSSWIIYVGVLFFIGARQHDLYTLNHDASHGNLFYSPRLNKVVSFFASILPFAHHPEVFSFILWKRIHFLHHSQLFTNKDPNYLSRKEQGDTDRKLSKLHLIKALALAPLEAVSNFFIGKQYYICLNNNRKWEIKKVNHQSLLWVKFNHDEEMEKERILKIFLTGALIAIVFYSGFEKYFLYYWLIPMYTTFPIILKLMDLTEHNWHKKSDDNIQLTTNSRAGNLLSTLFIDGHNRTLHLEHHLLPRVPFYRLKKFSKELNKLNQKSFEI